MTDPTGPTGPIDPTGEAAARGPGPVTRVRARRFGPLEPPDGVTGEEQLATEEPLEIRMGDRRVAVTMRTPGSDFELAAGWLYGEGLLGGHDDLRAVRYCTDVPLEPDQRFNVVTADLAGSAAAAFAAAGPSPTGPLAGRSFLVSSACGVCGRESLDDLRQRGYRPAADGPPLDPSTLAGLPDRLRGRQGVFDRTGGLHAAGLADAVTGELEVVREDVGRHNAVDKVVGWALLADRLPLSGRLLVVSGRASYELAQKAVGAGVMGLVSVSAPSSLAVQVAGEFGLLLAAFARDGRVTVYAGQERLAGSTDRRG